MSSRVCFIDGCDGGSAARGMCHSHYERWRRSGGVRIGGPLFRRGDVLGRFWAKVDKDGPLPGDETLAAGLGPCWIWTASQHGKGYGSTTYQGRLLSAHRASFVIHGGVLIDGMDIDHLCRVRLCVNPEHLEQVTHAENIKRGDTGITWRSKTHCLRGHPFDDENTHWFTTARGGSGRSCRACARERTRQSRLRQLAAS